MPTAAELGLESPQGAPAGAIEEISQGPQDVMEPPAFAYAGDSPPLDSDGLAGLLAPTGATAPGGTAQAAAAAPGGTTQTVEIPAQQQVPDPSQVQQAQAIRGLQGQLASLGRDAEMAVLQMVNSGVDREQAQFTVNLATRAAEAEINRQITEIASTPAVVAHVSADIARRFSLPGSPITVEDLRGERTVSGMEARARAIQDTRRTQQVQTRVERRADTVESAPGASFTTNRAGTGMSPFMMIRSGLSRRTVGR